MKRLVLLAAVAAAAAHGASYKLVASQFKGKKKEEPAPEPNGNASVSGGTRFVASTIGKIALVAYALCLAALPSPLNADDAFWTGGGQSASMGEAANWSTDPDLPSSTMRAIVNSTNGVIPEVSDGTTTYSKLLVGTNVATTVSQSQGTLKVTAQHPVMLGFGIGGIGTYNISGGTLSCPDTSDSALFVGRNGGVGYLNISGDGIVNCQKICLGTTKVDSTKPKGRLAISGDGKLNVRNDSYLGNTDNGGSEIVQSGGTYAGGHDVYLSQGTVAYTKTAGAFTVANDLQIGRNNNASATLTHNGGEMEVARDMVVGGGNSGSKGGVGTLVLGGGSIVVTRYTHIGGYGTGTFTQTGGSFQCNNWTAIGRQKNYTGNCTVTGGTFTVTNTAGLNIGEEGTGTLTVGGTGVVTAEYGTKLGANATGKGTLKLGGNGKIVTKYLMKGGGAATLAEFDGGTIQAMADEAAFLGNLGNIQLGAGGLTIDTQGYNLGITNCTFNVSSNSGKLNVVGGGTVTFTDVTVNVTDNPSQAITFAERTDGGTFEFEGGLPEFNYRGWKLRVSGDKKTVRLVPPGLVIVVM